LRAELGEFGSPNVSFKVEVVGLKRLFETMTEFSDRRMGAAVATALTRTAVGARGDLRKEMTAAFDRPTPFVVNSLVHRGATAQRLESAVLVRPGSPVLPALRTQVFGGPRRQKRFEELGASLGLPPGWLAVPGPGAELDANGNMSRQQLRHLLGQLGSSPSAPAKGRRRRTVKRYFTLPSGVYTRPPGAKDPIPVLFFVSSATYRPGFAFFELARQSFTGRFPAEMERAFNESVARWLQQRARR
jgi:hypothetical protein